MRRPRAARYLMFAVSFALASTLFAATTEGGCRVEQRPVNIVRHTFDPKNPPPELQRMLGNEAALCEAIFECVCTLRTVTPRGVVGANSATVTNVDVITTLRITIWTPQPGLQSYVDHEETHRRIAEYFYQRAPQIAQRLGQPMVGRHLLLPAGFSRDAVNDAIRRARQEFFDAYMRETHERSNAAQARFDAITDHGRAAIANDVAMAQALDGDR